MAPARVFGSRLLQLLAGQSPRCCLPSLITSFAAQRALSSSAFSRLGLAICSVPSTVSPLTSAASRFSHRQPIRCFSKYDKELVEFLDMEISTENRDGSLTKLPTQIGQFDVKLNQAEVSLVRNVNGEKVTVTLSVNAPVDADDMPVDDPDMQRQRDSHPGQAEEEETGQQQDRLPSAFTVDIEHGRKTVSFTCSFIHDGAVEDGSEEYTDHFCIDEIVMFEGEISDSCYTVSGSSIPADMYDLLMNTLEDRGIDGKFAQDLINFCTNYEQRCYIALLQGLQSFYSKN